MRRAAVDRSELKSDLLIKFVERQMEAGKWMLSSLLIVNGGAIVALLSNEQFGSAILEKVGIYYAIGAISAFITGGFSWGLSNAFFFSLRKQIGIKLFAGEQWPDSDRSPNYALTWFVGTIIFGLASLGSFAYATIEASLIFPIEQTDD